MQTTASSQYRVLLQKEQLIFSSAHFITFAGDICECLHGHNYGVKAEVEGPLDENRYVVDFIAFRDTLSGVVKQLDHHMLIATKHPLITVEELHQDDAMKSSCDFGTSDGSSPQRTANCWQSAIQQPKKSQAGSLPKFIKS